MALNEIFSLQGRLDTQVISYLMRHGAASRKELADKLSVTGATLTKISKDLIQKGIIYEKGFRESSTAGRKEICIDVMPDYCYALGMDIANRYLRVTLLNMRLELIAMREWRYPLLTEQVIDEGVAYMKSLIAEYGRERILGLGLLGQGYIYRDQFMSLPIHNIREIIESKIDVRISCMNNIRGIAITQSFLCNEDQNFLMLHYGPGVCTVMIQDGCIVPGYHNKAGEVGHVIWDRESGERCSVCGKTGCLESLVNFGRVARLADPAHNANYTDYDLLKKACANDGGKALDEALVCLAKAVNLLLGFSDPQELLLCGQIFTEREYYNRFTRLLFELDENFSEKNVALVENYSEKRWKSAGIVVMDEYFGNNTRNPF